MSASGPSGPLVHTEISLNWKKMRTESCLKDIARNIQSRVLYLCADWC